MAIVDTQNISDPSIEGTSGLKGVNTSAFYRDPEVDLAILNKARMDNYTLINPQPGVSFRLNTLNQTGLSEFVGNENVGDSRFDYKMNWTSDFNNLNDNRARLQSGVELVGVGILKGAVLAGTTFADGLVGTWVGLINKIAGGSFINNPFSETMQNINAWSESALPNYYRDHELDSPWYENIFTANFLGDKFLKNLGFAVGAAYAGRVNAGMVSKALGMGKARLALKGAVLNSADDLSKASTGLLIEGYNAGLYTLKPGLLADQWAKQAYALKSRENILLMAGSLSAGMGEARIEAIGNSNDYKDKHTNLLDNELDQHIKARERELLNSPKGYENFEIIDGLDGSKLMQLKPEVRLRLYDEIMPQYENGLAIINRDAARVANISFALNTALLTASDWMLFGKFYAGGYRNIGRAKNIAKDATGKYAQTTSKVKDFYNIAKNPFVEGNEEMMQSVIALGAGYEYDHDTLLSASSDPESNHNVTSFLKNMWTAMRDTYGDIDNYEEGLIGAFTGAIGVPSFRGMLGGIAQGYRDYRESRAKDNDLINALNESIKPEFISYYQNLVRNDSYQKSQELAAENGDEFSYKNDDISQLISNVITYDKAGRIDDLIDIIDGFGNVDANNKDLIDEIRSQTTDKVTGKSIYDGKSDLYVAETVNNQLRKYRDLVNKYQKISENLLILAGKSHTSQGLDELTWMALKIDNWEDRFKTIWGEILDGLTEVAPIFENINIDGQPLSQVILSSPGAFLHHAFMLGNADGGRAEAKEYEAKLLQKKDKRGLKSMQKKLRALQSAIKYSEDVYSRANELAGKTGDLIKILDARADFMNKYNEYLYKPEVLEKKLDLVKEKAQENQEKFENNNIRKEIIPTKELLKKAQTLDEFKTILNGFEDPDLPGQASDWKRRMIADELSKEDLPIAMNYMDINNTARNISNELDTEFEIPNELGLPRYSDRDLLYAKAILNLLKDLALSGDDLRNVGRDTLIVLSEEKDKDNAWIFPDKEAASRAIDLLLTGVNANNLSQLVLSSLMDAINKGSLTLKEVNTHVKLLQDLNPVSQPEIPVKDNTSLPVESKLIETTEVDLENKTDEPVPMRHGSTFIQDKVESTKDLRDGLNNKRSEQPKRGLSKFMFWKPSFAQHDTDGLEDGRQTPIYQMKGFEGLEATWKFLNGKGAWSYVNKGRLKIGDEVTLGVEPDSVNNPDIKGIPVFIYHGDLIVGIMPSSKPYKEGLASASDNHVEMTESLNRVLDEYNDFINSDPDNAGKVFKSSIKTTVTEVLPGRFSFTKSFNRPVKHITGIDVWEDPDGNSKYPTFSYVLAGVYKTPNVKDSNLDAGLLDSQGKEGRLYLRIHGADGRIYPANVTTAHFNAKEFDLTNKLVLASKTYNLLYNAYNRILLASIQLDAIPEDNAKARQPFVNEKISALEIIADILYFDGYIYAEVNNTPEGKALKINYRDTSKLEVGVDYITIQPLPLISMPGLGDVKEGQSVKYTVEDRPMRDNDVIILEIMQKTQDRNFRFQVDANLLNSSSMDGVPYNKRLIDDGLLLTNINNPYMVSAWFKMAPVRSDGTLYTKSEMGIETQPVSKLNTSNKNPVGGVESMQAATTVHFKIGRSGETKSYDIDANGNILNPINAVFKGIIEDLGLIKLALLGKPAPGTSAVRYKNDQVRLDKRGEILWVQLSTAELLKENPLLKPIEYILDKKAKLLEEEYLNSILLTIKSEVPSISSSSSVKVENESNLMSSLELELRAIKRPKAEDYGPDDIDAYNDAMTDVLEEEARIREKYSNLEPLATEYVQDILDDDMDIMAGAGMIVNREVKNRLAETPSTSSSSFLSMSYTEFLNTFPEVVQRKGFTELSWNQLTLEEREHEIKCASPF